MVIIPENFKMIRGQEHCQKSVTDGQTDRRTEITVLSAAWCRLKSNSNVSFDDILKKGKYAN